MKNAKMHPYLKAEKIEQINRELGAKISRDYEGKLGPDESLLVVVTLKGAMLFAADLVRHINVPVTIDFVRLTSYGSGTKSSGEVRILKDLEMNPEGRHILVLDEIADTGRTLHFLRNRIQSQSPKSVKICALLSKPSRREIPITVDYLGTDVEDKFLIGYGLDFNEKYRNLKDISYLEE